MMPEQMAAHCALVLETNNLRGGADAQAQASASLQRLMALLARQTLRFDLPVMTAVALLLFVLAVDGELDRVDGVLLLLAAAAYTIVLLRLSLGL